ncbi:MAG TPA: hypothetical protein VKY74_17085 [Chloroflexia bacterium]|nr:hypothetical protein [Chloroflexia bacterium]
MVSPMIVVHKLNAVLPTSAVIAQASVTPHRLIIPPSWPARQVPPDWATPVTGLSTAAVDKVVDKAVDKRA